VRVQGVGAPAEHLLEGVTVEVVDQLLHDHSGRAQGASAPH
jgi:hypothetical protein